MYMDRRTAITLGIILTVIIGAFCFLVFSPAAKDAMRKNLEQSAKQTSKNQGLGASQPVAPATTAGTETKPAAPTAPPAKAEAGKYVDYSQGALASTAGTKLIFFHAPWCPQCRAIEADIKQEGVPAGVTIFKADYDSSQALRQQYGVTIQTTVVRVDDQGNLVKKYVAYDEPSLAAVRKHLLP